MYTTSLPSRAACINKFSGAIDGLPHGLVSRALGRSWWDWDLDCWGHTRWVSWWV